jgi:hypothetical protein
MSWFGDRRERLDLARCLFPAQGLVMTLVDRLRAAWACAECRLYRRTALALVALATLFWMLR